MQEGVLVAMAKLWLLGMLIGPAAALLLTVPESLISISEGNTALLSASLTFPTSVPGYFQVRWRFVTGRQAVLILMADNCLAGNGTRPWRDFCKISVRKADKYRHRVELSSEDASLLLKDARAEDSGIYCITLLALDVMLSANISLTVTKAETNNTKYKGVRFLEEERNGMRISKSTGATGMNASTDQAESSSNRPVLASPPRNVGGSVSFTKAANDSDSTVSNIIHLSLAGLILCLLGLIIAEHVSFTCCSERHSAIRDRDAGGTVV
ncbi:uncharacterized protein LOC117042388 [Lacerta agilis]|uniref:uncharacterized protein LOC117042388 n=1 Tax=Lacerta agilis TaxID=80427 RepID=UPI0014192842|nr:uncharacterized protein LOC117042388 [Lacerta agilis]